MQNIKISATLLNTFSLFLNDTNDYYTAEKVIESINRKVVMTEKMMLGSKFGEILNDRIEYKEPIVVCGQSISPDIINEIRAEIGVEKAIAEGYCEFQIDSTIKLYGYFDFVNKRLYEVKSTSTIDYMKYKDYVQHKVYALSLGISDTCYIITDFSSWSKEEYMLDLNQVKHELYLLSRRFIEFIDTYRELIDFQYITAK